MKNSHKAQPPVSSTKRRRTSQAAASGAAQEHDASWSAKSGRS